MGVTIAAVCAKRSKPPQLPIHHSLAPKSQSFIPSSGVTAGVYDGRSPARLGPADSEVAEVAELLAELFAEVRVGDGDE